MKINNPIYIFVKGVLLISPFLLAQIFELFIFPIDYFTFRVWEAAISPYDRFPGRFYPNLNIYKEKEFGDRYRIGNDFKQHKPVHWQTDNYGWRNRPEVSNKSSYDIVTLGDSNIVGSFLDQKDTLAEVISRKSNLNVYNYSIGYDHIQYYFGDQRMVGKNTKLIVIESKVGNWFWTGDYLTNFSQNEDDSLSIVDRKTELINKFNNQNDELKHTILLSRLKKQALLNKIRSDLFIDTATQVNVSEKSNLINKIKLIQLAESNVNFNESNHKKRLLNLYSKNFVKGPEASIAIDIPPPKNAGGIKLIFDAVVTTAPSKIDVWLIQNGVRNLLTQINLSPNWSSYQIDIPQVSSTNNVRIEIQHVNSWQFLGLRNAKAYYFQSNNSSETSLSNLHSIKNVMLNDRCSQYPITKPANLRPIEPSSNLDPPESVFYFYQAIKAIKKQTDLRGQDFIFFLMPDPKTYVLNPAINRLRCEGVKLIAYENSSQYTWGVDDEWYWNHADSHWREQAVNLTADEILRIWINKQVANRPFNPQLANSYSQTR